MNKITKYAGLLAILPLFAVAFTSSYISDADAVISTDSETNSDVELASIQPRTEGRYEVTFFVYAGDEAQQEGKLLVTSDKVSKEVNVLSIRANSFTSVQTNIVADDPRSISAEILSDTNSVMFAAQALGEKDSGVKLSSIQPKTDDRYEVTFFVYAGDEAQQEGKLLVTSDRSSKEVGVLSIRADSFTSVRTNIVADDPRSISAEMLSNTNSALVATQALGEKDSGVELARINAEPEGVYDVIFFVYAGDEAQQAGKLLVSSDTVSKEVNVPSIRADSFTSVRTDILADDPISISAEILG